MVNRCNRWREDELLLDKLSGVPGAATVEAAMSKVGSTIPLFGSVDVRPLREILLESQILYPAPGTVIFSLSDYSDSFYSILGGEVFIQLLEEEPDLIACS